MGAAGNNSEGTGRTIVSGLVLGIDTCGPSGSVALARVNRGTVDVLGQRELAGRSYSATLVSAVRELLHEAQTQLSLLHAMVVVNGPGSFTGVRVGVSAAKGLAEGRAIGIVPVSRLEVLAAKGNCDSAALDAHRGELFVRVQGRELLAGREQLAAIDPVPVTMTICDDAAESVLQGVWPRLELLQVEAPTAADAIRLCAARIEAGEFADLALLDGHYLRRSDAEIFGDPGARAKSA